MGWAILIIGLLGVTIAAAEFARVRRDRRALREAAALWRETPADDRASALELLLAGRARSAGAWYLLGCALFRRQRYSAAARCFGMAYHLDDELVSAALLVFTCLKTATSRENGTTLLRQLAQTYDEIRRPALAHDWKERILWDLLAESTSQIGAPSAGPARLIWLVGSEQDRAALARIRAESPAWAAPLWSARPGTDLIGPTASP